MNSPKLPTPHNNLFQYGLSSLPTVRSLIETQFPVEVLKEFLLDTLAYEEGSFIDPDLREKYSDLLMSVQLANSFRGYSDRALVYFLFEHKSEDDPVTVLQLLSYIIRVWEKLLRSGLPLCPIIPLVVYHGEKPWLVARSIQELVPAPEALRGYSVQFGFPLLDLSAASDDQILGEPFLQTMLRLLKYGRSADLAFKLKEILEILAKLALDKNLEARLHAIRMYVMAVSKTLESDEFESIVDSVFPTQYEPGSIVDQLLTKGRKEGRDEGFLIGQIQLLEDICELPSTSREVLEKMSLELLEAMHSNLQSQLRSRKSE